MGTLKNLWTGIASGVRTSLRRTSSSRGDAQAPPPIPRRGAKAEVPVADVEHGRMPGAETIAVDPDRVRTVRISYTPDRDGDPDAGEVVWTWVPYVENDGRGKDRPVLVIGRHTLERVYAVRMTSKPRDHDRDYIPIGAGPWDSQGRASWVDIEQLYSLHVAGMRREAAILDPVRYGAVAEALVRRYGWAVDE